MNLLTRRKNNFILKKKKNKVFWENQILKRKTTNPFKKGGIKFSPKFIQKKNFIQKNKKYKKKK